MRTGGHFRGESGILMDNYIIGDLTDIFRGSGGCCPDSKSSTFAEESIPLSSDPWQLPMNRSSSNNGNTDDSADVMPPSSSMDDSFGDPFSVMRDPLLHGLDSVFFNSNSSSMASPADMTNAVNGDDVFVPNMFTRMLQMSAANDPSHSQLPVSLCSESSVVASSSLMEEIKINSGSPTLVGHLHRGDGEMNLDKSKSCLMSNSRMQILSPNNSGIKRRKSQAKKVVCIPAPAAANSRASEVVPSDLWAWRKYGQKPIKGSPYPRGYYRCSSSKGCSARKQVERSLTNPNMLVITYTSEHNHPWPTHRNALAGSRRSQPSKNGSSNAVNNLNGSQINTQVQKEATEILKEQKNETDNALSNTTATIKEEVEDAERHTDIDGVREFSTVPDEANSTDDFFADLAEIDGDPLQLLFNQGNGGDGTKESEGLDPFGIFDWPEEHNPPFIAK